MKLIYSHLKKFLPGLNVEPHQLRDDLTSIGHFTNYFEPLDTDFVFDLDVKVNRGDCLGYYGLSRDLSVLYQVPLQQPPLNLAPPSTEPLPIEVTAPAQVKRVMALRISNLKNSPSPDWLRSFVEAHQLNSVNTIVDLTNFAMLYWGIPNHAFDTAKSGSALIWELNTHYPEFTTLDGTTLKLKPGILMVNSPTIPLSLSFLGGQACAIDLNTTEIIIEMAVYDRTQVKSDSRFLKTITEAGIRLDKDLDPNLITQAFSHLATNIISLCGGQASSALFDYYPTPATSPSISFDPTLPSTYAGIEIPTSFATQSLLDLGCQITDNLVTPPTIRPDLNLEEDLIEEVMRFWGYNKIPTSEPISNLPLPSITPPIITLSNFLKLKMVEMGYDEVLSWPLVKTPADPPTVVSTQNSLNSDYPHLRQNLTTSILSQLDSYLRYKLPNPQFFEIGTVFNKIDNKFIESVRLAFYHHDRNQINNTLLELQKTLGLNTNIPQLSSTPNIFEIDLTALLPTLDLSLVSAPPSTLPLSQAVVELSGQIITLDANITLTEPQDTQMLLNKYVHIVDPQYLWSLSIIDQYSDPTHNVYRYTFRASYYNCTDKVAKKLHLQSFGLL
ncbi:MAG: phenylalanine--tRNA ligase beta subunit-related protein [Candidatus Shapirobacteria bacterium]